MHANLIVLQPLSRSTAESIYVHSCRHVRNFGPVMGTSKVHGKLWKFLCSCYSACMRSTDRDVMQHMAAANSKKRTTTAVLYQMPPACVERPSHERGKATHRWQQLLHHPAASCAAPHVPHQRGDDLTKKPQHMPHTPTTCYTRLVADMAIYQAHMLLVEHCWSRSMRPHLAAVGRTGCGRWLCSRSAQRCVPGCTSSDQLIQVPLQLLNEVLLQCLLHAATAAAAWSSCC
jgi:hypothetical protein